MSTVNDTSLKDLLALNLNLLNETGETQTPQYSYRDLNGYDPDKENLITASGVDILTHKYDVPLDKTYLNGVPAETYINANPNDKYYVRDNVLHPDKAGWLPGTSKHSIVGINPYSTPIIEIDPNNPPKIKHHSSTDFSLINPAFKNIHSLEDLIKRTSMPESGSAADWYNNFISFTKEALNKGYLSKDLIDILTNIYGRDELLRRDSLLNDYYSDYKPITIKQFLRLVREASLPREVFDYNNPVYQEIKKYFRDINYPLFLEAVKNSNLTLSAKDAELVKNVYYNPELYIPMYKDYLPIGAGGYASPDDEGNYEIVLPYRPLYKKQSYNDALKYVLPHELHHAIRGYLSRRLNLKFEDIPDHLQSTDRGRKASDNEYPEYLPSEINAMSNLGFTERDRRSFSPTKEIGATTTGNVRFPLYLFYKTIFGRYPNLKDLKEFIKNEALDAELTAIRYFDNSKAYKEAFDNYNTLQFKNNPRYKLQLQKLLKIKDAEDREYGVDSLYEDYLLKNYYPHIIKSLLNIANNEENSPLPNVGLDVLGNVTAKGGKLSIFEEGGKQHINNLYLLDEIGLPTIQEEALHKTLPEVVIYNDDSEFNRLYVPFEQYYNYMRNLNARLALNKVLFLYAPIPAVYSRWKELLKLGYMYLTLPTKEYLNYQYDRLKRKELQQDSYNELNAAYLEGKATKAYDQYPLVKDVDSTLLEQYKRNIQDGELPIGATCINTLTNAYGNLYLEPNNEKFLSLHRGFEVIGQKQPIDHLIGNRNLLPGDIILLNGAKQKPEHAIMYSNTIYDKHHTPIGIETALSHGGWNNQNMDNKIYFNNKNNLQNYGNPNEDLIDYFLYDAVLPTEGFPTYNLLRFKGNKDHYRDLYNLYLNRNGYSSSYSILPSAEFLQSNFENSAYAEGGKLNTSLPKEEYSITKRAEEIRKEVAKRYLPIYDYINREKHLFKEGGSTNLETLKISLKEDNTSAFYGMSLDEIFKMTGLDSKYRITSSYRPNNKFKSGLNSWHTKKNGAFDVVAINGNTNYALFIRDLMSNAIGRAWVMANNYGFYDETNAENLAKTGGTGKHIHVGKDSRIPRVVYGEDGVLKYIKGGSYNEVSTAKMSKNEQIFRENLEKALAKTSHQEYNTPEWRQFFTEIARLESGFSPTVVSSAGAKGIFLLMPYEIKRPWKTTLDQYEDMFDHMAKNENYMQQYLTEQDKLKLELLGINWREAHAIAHFSGVGGLRKWLRRSSPNNLIGGASDGGTNLLGYLNKYRKSISKYGNPNLEVYNFADLYGEDPTILEDVIGEAPLSETLETIPISNSSTTSTDEKDIRLKQEQRRKEFLLDILYSSMLETPTLVDWTKGPIAMALGGPINTNNNNNIVTYLSLNQHMGLPAVRYSNGGHLY